MTDGSAVPSSVLVTLVSRCDDKCHGPRLTSVSTFPNLESASQLRPTGQMPVSAVDGDHPTPAGRDISITWWYTFISIAGMSIFLLGLAAMVCLALISTLDGASWQTLVVLILFIGSGISCVYASWLIRDGYGSGWPRPSVTTALLTAPVIAWVTTVFIPGATLYGAAPLWITLSIMLPLITRRQRLIVTALGVVLLVMHGALSPGTPVLAEERLLFSFLLLVMLTPPTFLFSGWLWHLITRLDDARVVSGQLAVTRERLRFASDLHDIQGHHLQVIALKAELADRLLSSDSPQHRTGAQQAISEVRSLAEQAQSETRQLVRDLRVVSLDDEVENARGVLEAAGITTEVTIEADATGSRSAAANRLLGFAVREATTNILRHSRAQHVTIALTTKDQVHLEISNDGAVTDAKATAGAQGSGLASLRQRFQQAGGTLTTNAERATFQLRATLPQTVEETRL